MKYADGLWLNKPGYGVNYATQMYEVTADETSINVLATNQWIGNRGMTLGGPVLEITFTSTLENTIKVSIDHYKGRVHKSPRFPAQRGQELQTRHQGDRRRIRAYFRQY